MKKELKKLFLKWVQDHKKWYDHNTLYFSGRVVVILKAEQLRKSNELWKRAKRSERLAFDSLNQWVANGYK